MSETTQTITETTAVEPVATTEVPQEAIKPYTFRKLSSPDVFPMMKIIGLIGVNEFTACFENDFIINTISSLFGKKEENEEGKKESGATIVGVSVALEIVNVLFNNLPKCEKYIYQLLSQTSNLTEDEVKALDMVVFLEMIVDFIKKDEFKDFTKVASGLLK